MFASGVLTHWVKAKHSTGCMKLANLNTELRRQHAELLLVMTGVFAAVMTLTAVLGLAFESDQGVLFVVAAVLGVLFFVAQVESLRNMRTVRVLWVGLGALLAFWIVVIVLLYRLCTNDIESSLFSVLDLIALVCLSVTIPPLWTVGMMVATFPSRVTKSTNRVGSLVPYIISSQWALFLLVWTTWFCENDTGVSVRVVTVVILLLVLELLQVYAFRLDWIHPRKLKDIVFWLLILAAGGVLLTTLLAFVDFLDSGTIPQVWILVFVLVSVPNMFVLTAAYSEIRLSTQKSNKE